uniref:Uncharacterized protein n=1 Tax=Capra hircus TaxID=9925 RepID=A0A8C2XSN2_CAPHI
HDLDDKPAIWGDNYTHSACRNTYQSFNGMDRDYGPGSYGGLAFKDVYLKILLLSASKGDFGCTYVSLLMLCKP